MRYVSEMRHYVLGGLVLLLVVLLLHLDGMAAAQPTGRIIAIKDDIITVQLDNGGSGTVPKAGDVAKISYILGEDAINYGTWQVTAVLAGGIVKAEPKTVIKPPTIGLQAVFQPGENQPAAGEIPPPSKQEKKPEPELQGTPPPAQEVKRQETDVTRDFSGLGKKVSCEIGSVRIDGSRIEIHAKEVKGWENYCWFPVSDEILEDFRLTFDLEVAGKNFIAGLVFGDLSENSLGVVDIIMANMTNKVGSSKWWEKKTDSAHAWFTWYHLDIDGPAGPMYGASALDFFWNSHDGENGSNPTPGSLEFIKNGSDCMIFWNGEKLLAFEENTISRGRVGIMFKPISGGRDTAVFRNISVKRLD